MNLDGLNPRSDPPDPELQGFFNSLQELLTKDSIAAGNAVRLTQPIDSRVTSYAITLLDGDETAAMATRALHSIAPSITGQLTDHLLDHTESLQTRLRIVPILAAIDSDRAMDGMIRALSTHPLEVRYRCGMKLAWLDSNNSDCNIDRSRVLTAVRHEIKSELPIWKAEPLVWRWKNARYESIQDTLLGRARLSLEHAFRLLRLALGQEAVWRAYEALQTTNQHLRGVAFEYLDAVLPKDIRRSLLPILEESRVHSSSSRPIHVVIAELIAGHESLHAEIAEWAETIRYEG